MVSALRSLAWLVFLIGAVLTVIGSVSFFVDIPGMWLNGEPVETDEQRTLFVAYSLGFALLGSAFLWLARTTFLRRYARVLRAARWLEEFPTENRTGRRTVFGIIFMISVFATLVSPHVGSFGDRMFSIIALPAMFCLGFLMTFIVVGFQVVNPFCPKALLRFFALVTMAFFGLGSILSVPAMFVSGAEDAAVLWVPMTSLGAALGSIVVLKKWGDFRPAFREKTELPEA